MKYDQAWLRRVTATKQVIPKVDQLIQSVPQIGDRNLLRITFDAAVLDFERELEGGRDTSYTAGKITDLYNLADELANAPVEFG